MASEESIVDIEKGIPWIPSFLENSEEEVLNHKLQATKAFKQLNEQYDLFISYVEDVLALEGNYQNHPSEYTQCEKLLKKLQRECNADENKVFKYDQCVKSSETELKILKELNEKLQDEILQFCEDTEKLALQEQQLLKQRKEANEKILLMYNTYVTAKKWYKEHLFCQIRLHGPEEPAHNSNSELGETLTFKYMMSDKAVIKVTLNRDGGMWKMLDTEPFVPAAVEAQTNLRQTNDIRGFLCRLREEASKLSRE